MQPSLRLDAVAPSSETTKRNPEISEQLTRMISSEIDTRIDNATIRQTPRRFVNYAPYFFSSINI
jgi:hypothetical protein